MGVNEAAVNLAWTRYSRLVRAAGDDPCPTYQKSLERARVRFERAYAEWVRE